MCLRNPNKDPPWAAVAPSAWATGGDMRQVEQSYPVYLNILEHENK